MKIEIVDVGELNNPKIPTGRPKGLEVFLWWFPTILVVELDQWTKGTIDKLSVHVLNGVFVDDELTLVKKGNPNYVNYVVVKELLEWISSSTKKKVSFTQTDIRETPKQEPTVCRKLKLYDRGLEV